MNSLLRLIAMAFAAAMFIAGPALAGNTKLNVVNLPYTTTGADLRNAFSAYGTVQDVFIATDKVTGRPRGFAIVTMGTSSEAEAAITGLNGKDFNGRILEVKIAVSREEDTSSSARGARPAKARKAAPAWTKCADENGTCTLKADQTIRYGANGTFVTKTGLTGAVVCNNATFGDPLPLVAKTCEVR